MGLCLVGRGICVLRMNPWKQEFLSAFLLNSTYHPLTFYIYIFTLTIVYLSLLDKVPRGRDACLSCSPRNLQSLVHNRRALKYLLRK